MRPLLPASPPPHSTHTHLTTGAQGLREGSEVYSFAWARPCHLGLQRKVELSWVWVGRDLA